MFKEVNPKPSFPKLEEEVLKYWQKNNTFQKSIAKRVGAKDYVFYDGPPFATGTPHYGHLTGGAMKDVIPRYRTMKGYRVERRFGWDCHGLPVEYEKEKEFKKETGNEKFGKRDIEEMGVDKFNEACRAIVLRYTAEWEKTVDRMGRWVDFQNDYKTMDPDYMESIWWVFKQIYDKGLIYEGTKSVPYCPRCATPLSNFEIADGYMDVQDPALTVKFKLTDEDVYFLAWTTTPWTLPSNLGLAVGADIDYAKIEDKDSGEVYILAKARLGSYYQEEDGYEILEEFKGGDLEEKTYEPIYPYFQDLKNGFRILTADFVSIEDGTGVVHIAPGFGEDDNRLGQEKNLPFVCPVNDVGNFTDEVTDYAGQYVKDADKEIIKDLKDRGVVVRHDTYTHSYPHCWRCETPLLQKAIPTWFVRVTEVKDRMIKNAKPIYWFPTYIKENRFGKWLEGVRDWGISRNRYWGTPLPLWKCECGEITCVGSRDELKKLSGTDVTDLHKHFVDQITFPCPKCGKDARRIPEVLDCWFESGSMPYAQQHYPFENKEKFEQNFPAQFVAEGVEQTRLWFYVQHVIATILFDKNAYENVICNGIVLAEDGKKMSKRLKNYPDPTLILDTYGADAMRFYLMASPVTKAENLRFSERGVNEVVKSLVLPLWNAYSFFVTYANVDGFVPTGKLDPQNDLDRFILSSLQKLNQQVTGHMDAYDLPDACAQYLWFIDNLNNWYIRRSRRRFWKSANDADKMQAYETLYHVLKTFCQILAPFMPFITEEIYRGLTGEESVHLTDWPSVDKKLIDQKLDEKISLNRLIINLGHAARVKSAIRVRQPLAKIELGLPPNVDRKLIDLEVIKEELNVKDLDIKDDPTTIAKAIIKPDASKLGPKYGADVQKIIAEAKAGNFEQMSDGKVQVLDFILNPDEVEIGYLGKEGFDVESAQGIVVALDVQITPALELEGRARDLVRLIQDLRKEAGYQVSDRITVLISGADEVVDKWGEYIKAETLAVEIVGEGEGWDKEAEDGGVGVGVRSAPKAH